MLRQERVEFFNSESSFGSESSLASSRYFDLTNQIAEQTQTVLATLKRQFQPTHELTNFDKIDYLHNRANILCRDTIPQHVQYLNKIGAPREALQVCKQSERKLEKFIKDYEALRKGELLHKQFYNIYGRSMENNVFFKKQKANGFLQPGQVHGMLEPDVESIQEIKSTRFRQQNKLTSRSTLPQAKPNNDKLIMQLQQEIAIMKKRQADMKKQFDYLLTAQKQNCEKRINSILKAVNSKLLSPQSGEFEDSLKNQNIRLAQEITKTLKDKQQLLEKNSLLQKTIKELQNSNRSLKEELVGYRKMQLSRFEDIDHMSQSFQSEQNSGEDSSSIRKLQSQVKKLTSQRDLLKAQLNRQRELSDKQKLYYESNQSKEITRLKSYLQARNKQNEELHRQLDKTRVEYIQLKHENKVLAKNLSSVKGNSQQLKKALQQMDLTASNHWETASLKANNLITFKNKADSRALEKSGVSSGSKPPTFEQYQGQGIEGYPYYELLQKQFKIRFKRACLKNKQLLYKANGLEIGVISQFSSPNVIKILVHITNSSEADITAINVKGMNPNDNKIQCDIQKIQRLMPNQQVKIPVCCTLKNYPIGPVVFALDYISDTKHDVRLLLPAHIFKCVTIEPRSQDFYKSTKLSVKTERKICKDLTSLKEYLNCQDEVQIKVQIRHEHSGSLLYMNANLIKDQVQIQYEHVSGTEKFTQYFIKTFKSLLQKDN